MENKSEDKIGGNIQHENASSTLLPSGSVSSETDLSLVASPSQEESREVEKNFPKLKAALMADANQDKNPKKSEDGEIKLKTLGSVELNAENVSDKEERKSNSPPQELIRSAIDQNNAFTLDEQLSEIPEKDHDLINNLVHAVTKYKSHAVSCLLSRIIDKHISLKDELDNLLAICIQGMKSSNADDGSNAKKILKALFLALPSLGNDSNYTIDQLTRIFTEFGPKTIGSSTKGGANKNDLVFWLLKIKFKIPLGVATTNDLPIYGIMKNLAENINVDDVEKNAYLIELLTKNAVKESSSSLMDYSPQISNAIQLAIMLDNSGANSPNYGRLTAFRSILNGISEALKADSDKVEKMVKLFLYSFDEKVDTGNPILKDLSHKLKTELEKELTKYYDPTKDSEKTTHLRNIKLLAELANALSDENYALAMNIAKQLPYNRDSRFKSFLGTAIPVLVVLSNATVLFLPQITGGQVNDYTSILLYSAIAMALPFIVKMMEFRKNNAYNADSDSFRYKISELKGTRFWHAISQGASNQKISNNIASRTAKIDSSIGKHPLHYLISGFDDPPEEKTIDSDGEGSQQSLPVFSPDSYSQQTQQNLSTSGPIQSWKDEFIKAVREGKSKKAGSLLTKAINNGEEVGNKLLTPIKKDSKKIRDQKVKFEYGNSDPLVHAFHICLQKNDFATFRNLLNAISDESRYGKFTFDLLSMVLDNENLDESQKSHYMFTIVKAKLGEHIDEVAPNKENPALYNTLKLIITSKRYENVRHLRILAVMAKLSARRLNNTKGEEAAHTKCLDDMSEAISAVASLSTGPISPHGYIDAFTSMMYGICSELSPDDQPRDPGEKPLSEENINQIVKLMTHKLQKEIGAVTLELERSNKSERSELEERKSSLEKNMKLIEDSMRIRLAEINEEFMDPKSRSWLSVNFNHLKNLFHYTHALCVKNPNPTPKQIWMASEEPQESSRTKRWAFSSTPYLLSLLSAAIGSSTARGYLHLNMSSELASAITIIIMVAAAVLQNSVNTARTTGTYLPPAVKSTEETEGNFAGTVVTAQGSLMKVS